MSFNFFRVFEYALVMTSCCSGYAGKNHINLKLLIPQSRMTHFKSSTRFCIVKSQNLVGESWTFLKIFLPTLLGASPRAMIATSTNGARGKDKERIDCCNSIAAEPSQKVQILNIKLFSNNNAKSCVCMLLIIRFLTNSNAIFSAQRNLTFQQLNE